MCYCTSNFALTTAICCCCCVHSNMYKILGEDKVMVDKLAPERLEAEYSLVRRGGGWIMMKEVAW